MIPSTLQNGYNNNKKEKISSVGENIVKLEPSCFAGGNVNSAALVEICGGSSKSETSYDPAFHRTSKSELKTGTQILEQQYSLQHYSQ